MQSAQLDAPTCWFCKIQYVRAMSRILGQAGIGGILHSSDGVKLMFFSKHIGVANPNLAEIHAIKEALSVLLSQGLRGFADDAEICSYLFRHLAVSGNHGS
ncbi:hypothetical protein Goshw_029632 [Gossypium schwendimanii]|uniref:Uncharacterized protein n=1 Tax=Gossypium schwendimanii TaxID=34291 RepID=A0A7J9N470_GOSSC|nr:hypothetical protein [Gossypium schwendimanii]